MAFLDKGAKLLEELETSLTSREILLEKETLLKTILLEEGVKSIESYHEVREKRLTLEAKINSIIRQIENMLI